MVVLDEQTGVKRTNAATDEQFWSRVHDMHADNIESRKRLIAGIERADAEDRASMAKAAEARDAAKARRERLERGEDVPGGLGKPFTREDAERALREAGMTASDIRRAEAIGSLSKSDFEVFLQEVHTAIERAEKTAKRAALRRRNLI
jgi:hypothetical protein